MTPRPVAVLLAGALLATGACSGGPDPAPTQPSTPSEAATAATAPSVAPGAPAADCLNGSYHLDRFVGVGDNQTYGTGEGGDVSITFTDGAYTLEGAGRDPIKLTLAGGTGDLTVDGAVRGSYTGGGQQYDFTVEKSDGSATLAVGGQRKELSMADAANLIAPDGRATPACNPPKLVLLLTDTRLELSRP